MAWLMDSSGSSPLARGGREPCPALHVREGLIPARAGRTMHTRQTAGSTRAHPRSRGADRSEPVGDARRIGSSPLARGGRCRVRLKPRDRRLIPARAGRTRAARHRPHGPGAHPRSRGADTAPPVERRTTEGSSPLARGGPEGKASGAFGKRLIPARAGRTPSATRTLQLRRAHPRSRGADAAQAVSDTLLGGSSPLARGGRGESDSHESAPRLIPARARRTPSCPTSSARRGAHPRSRGADVAGGEGDQQVAGSSPLARGGRPRTVRRRPTRRLIPARAGRTRSAPPTRTPSTAHPRSRGADRLTTRRSVTGCGSSPLARGGREVLD